jgi:hypothetical protein
MTFKDDLLRPFNLAMTVITIVSLVLAVISIYNGRKIRNISYQINQPIAKIFDSENSTPALKLIERDSVPITENVYLLTGIIWNNGNLPITKEDVREAISIKLINCKRILDYKLVKQSDPSIAKFSLTKRNNNTLNIDWSYFDPGYGFNFQIVYSGKEDPGFLINGKVLDVSSFTKAIPNTKNNYWINWSVLILWGLYVGTMTYFAFRKKENFKWDTFKIIVISLFFVFMIVIGYSLTLFLLQTAPSFY